MAGVYRRASFYLAPAVLAIGIAGCFTGCGNLFGVGSKIDRPDEYTITFDSAGGTPVESITQEAGTAITPPADPTRESYIFATWNPALPATMPAEDLSVVARWLHEDLAALAYRNMVSVPGGTFTQVAVKHDGTAGDSFQHTISSFEIAKYQATYELWYTVRQWALGNGYAFANDGREGSHGATGGVPTAGGKHEPVTSVSWRDTIVWLNAYSKMAGLTPVYYTDTAQTIPIKDSNAPNEVQTEAGSIDNPYVDWGANGYRLPTQSEWQYAASYQDGTSWTPFNYASGAADNYENTVATGAVAWYVGNSDTDDGQKTQPVGTKNANQLGIHDMSGNVMECAWDWAGDYPLGPETDYQGPETGPGRIFRGGHWDGAASLLQLGVRMFASPLGNFDIFGFRPLTTAP